VYYLPHRDSKKKKKKHSTTLVADVTREREGNKPAEIQDEIAETS
jgi:hypothetical protein